MTGGDGTPRPRPGSSTASGIDEILARWRDEVKGKQRRIISFEETVDLKVRSIRGLVHPQRISIEGWTHRRFIYTSKGERDFIDDEWRPIAVGDTWGGPDMSALFRCRSQGVETACI